MAMNRRDFLKLGVGAAGMLAFPEVLSKFASPQAPSIGFTFATWSTKLYDQDALDRLADIGIKDIAIHIPSYMRSNDSINISRFSRKERVEGWQRGIMNVPLDETICLLAEEARRRDMTLMVKPSTFVENDGWHGTIEPYDVKQWFSNYSAFIEHYAKIAQRCGAEYFSVGNEMSSMLKHENHWRELIRMVRSEFKGKMTYSESNFEYDKVPFYDALDYIGINAFFPLRFNYAEQKGSDFFFSKLMGAWWHHARAINSFTRSLSKPFMFTEFGVRSVDDAVFKPWDFEHQGSPDPIEQYKAYHSLMRALRRRIVSPEKVYLWSSDHGTDISRNRPMDYDFIGKPAEGVIRRYIKGNPL
jgi:hypothetical protein